MRKTKRLLIIAAAFLILLAAAGTAALSAGDGIYVMPGGTPIAAEGYTDGVMVMRFEGAYAKNGVEISPGFKAGLKLYDLIYAADGVPMDSYAALSQCLDVAHEDISLSVWRNGRKKTVTLPYDEAHPFCDYGIGVGVSESLAGAGTLSFYDISTMAFGAFGHEMLPSATVAGENYDSIVTPLREGSIYDAPVSGVMRSASGMPGHLLFMYYGGPPIGSLMCNSSNGVYGVLRQPVINPVYPEGVLLAGPKNVKKGDAELLVTTDGSGVKAYSCKITKTGVKVFGNKGFSLTLTDPALLELTGGSVQGMSGSPVIQNGMLVGVMSGAYVKSPEKALCVYASGMYEAAVDMLRAQAEAEAQAVTDTAA